MIRIIFATVLFASMVGCSHTSNYVEEETMSKLADNVNKHVEFTKELYSHTEEMVKQTGMLARETKGMAKQIDELTEHVANLTLQVEAREKRESRLQEELAMRFAIAMYPVDSAGEPLSCRIQGLEDDFIDCDLIHVSGCHAVFHLYNKEKGYSYFVQLNLLGSLLVDFSAIQYSDNPQNYSNLVSIADNPNGESLSNGVLASERRPLESRGDLNEEREKAYYTEIDRWFDITSSDYNGALDAAILHSAVSSWDMACTK